MYLSEIFKALGDDNRLRILNLLSKHELCVCQIIDVIKILQPNASKHLIRLRYAGITSCRKISQWCFYRISEEFKNNHAELLDFLIKEWESRKRYIDDMALLEKNLADKDCYQKLLEGNVRQAAK